MEKINLLGCAWSQVPLVFDVIYETYGIKDFIICKNIVVEDTPEKDQIMRIYNFSVREPGDADEIKGSPAVFGVTGPKAKHAVFSYFNERYGLEWADLLNVAHPTSYMATSARTGRGLFIEPGVILSTMAEIGNGVTLKRGVSIGHNSIVGEFSEINPGVTVSGNTEIGRGCIIGLGAVIKNKIIIGENTYIGMGSVVTGDIPPGVIAYGNPCKVVRENTGWKI